RQRLGRRRDPSQGAPLRLVLAASTTIGNYLLPPRIAELLRQAPQAEVDLRIDNSAGVVTAVQRLDVDAGLIEGPCHERGLQVTAWQQDPLVIVAAADAPARWSLDELSRARWLLREPGSGTREAVEQALLPHLRGFAQTLQLGNTEAIKQAAIAGLGLACLSRHALEEPLALGRLRVLETPLPALQRTLWLVRHPGKQWLPGLQALLGDVE
ncbi:LysR family transcriptional regulator, partial [Stenotrophomonas maltophilia]